MKLKNITALFLLIALPLLTVAREIKTKAELDSAVILIGDQVKLNVEIQFPDDVEIFFPVPSDSLGKHVEIVERSTVDSIKIDENTLKMMQEFTVTSFDTGHHTIEPFKFSFNVGGMSDTIKTNPTTLHVFTLPKLDSLMNAMQGPIDIKEPYEAPVTFKEIAPWLFGILLGAGLIFLIIYAINRRKNNKPIFSFPQKPKEPAHIIALRELDQIKEQKLWQQGKIKEYYSEVTDALREYIENRFGITAMELTTEEIIRKINEQKGLLDEKSYEYLKQMLSSADLVKFAKYTPQPEDNEILLVNAYFFINQTKIEEQSEEESEEEEEGEDVFIK
ncbi:MAG TPA: BatD family protein [Prolixibacteraceae bacterium]|nr:BatD family protein [Prolixibacteraceae bacterium]